MPRSASSPGTKSQLDLLTEVCLRLPWSVCERCGRHAAFKVKGKTFAWFLDDHHGDGIVAVSCKVAPGDNATLVKSQPEKFFMPAYVGSRGWVALRLDTAEVDWEEVAELVTDGYRRIAPKRLAALMKLAR